MFPLMFSPMVPNLYKLGNDYNIPPTVYALLNSYVNFSKEEPEKIKDLDLNDVDLFFGTTFNIVLGTKYLYQDENMPLDIWDINEENDENLGLIAEISEFPDDIIWLLPENDGERTLLWESYK